MAQPDISATRLDELDLDHLAGWIGREEVALDRVTPGLLDRYRATFGAWLFEPEEGAPPGLAWCLAPAAVPAEGLGPDGHPLRGGFLPPVPFETRMWAGGEMRLHRPFRAGDRVRRVSTVRSITPKEGRSGPLVFVEVDHRYEVEGRLVVEERQDLVYRPARPPARPAAERGDPPPGAFVGHPVTLFRYSALTFNGHRIHYDHPYATGAEGYADLVVHGPLQATLLMNAAARLAGTAAIRFSYRGLAPLVAGEPVTIREAEDRVRLEKPDGTATFEARFAPLKEGGA